MPLGYSFWLHALGTVGAAMLLVAYWLVSKNKIEGDSRLYQLLNVAGSVVLAVYAALLQAWSSMALNIVWTFIGLAMLRAIAGKKKEKPAQ
jgi:cytochrome bd-type quinol oxidase subunit 2